MKTSPLILPLDPQSPSSLIQILIQRINFKTSMGPERLAGLAVCQTIVSYLSCLLSGKEHRRTDKRILTASS